MSRAITTDIAEVVLDVLLDHERPWFAALQIHQPELIVLVTATIDSNDNVVGPGDVSCGRDGLLEKRELDEVIALSAKPIHLHAAGVIAADQELGTVRRDVGYG